MLQRLLLRKSKPSTAIGITTFNCCAPYIDTRTNGFRTSAVREKKATTFNLAEGFSKFTEQWSPRIAGEINNMHLKLVKVEGDFVWHHHDTEDELFLVTKGELNMKIRDPDERMEVVQPGEVSI